MASVALHISAGLSVFLVIAVGPWLAQTVSAYSESPSSASGSGDSSVPECKAPPYSNPSIIGVNPADDELQVLILEGRCYLACAAEKYQVDHIIQWSIKFRKMCHMHVLWAMQFSEDTPTDHDQCFSQLCI